MYRTIESSDAPWTRSLTAILVAGCLIMPGAGRAMTYAVLIGVENNAAIGRAEFAENDAKLLRQTLDDRGDVDPDRRIRVLSDSSPSQLRPTRENILRTLRSFFHQVTAADRAVVFFSGHGILDPDTKKTYLAPLDCDPRRPQDTGVPLSFIRDVLRGCQAGSKLLILDACHAGNPKGGTARPATAEEIKADLGDAAGVYTLASCKGSQKSYPMPEKKLGLFTFFLNVGLGGAADKDTNGKVTADELYSYVQPMVNRASKQDQTPDRIVEAGAGEVEVLTLRPEDAKKAVKRLAQQIHLQCKANAVKALGVFEFVREDRLVGEVVDNMGSFARNATRDLEDTLQEWEGRDYQVIRSRQINSTLGRDARPDRMATLDNLRELGERTSAQAMLHVTFKRVSYNKAIRVRAELVKTTGEALATMTTLVENPDTHFFVDGLSAIVPRSEVIPGIPQIRNPKVRDWMQFQSEQDHPFFNPDLPYRLEIRDAAGQQAKPVFFKQGDKKRVYVRAKPGERFTLFVANRTGTVGGGTGYSYGYGSSASSRSTGLNKVQDYNGDVFVRLWVDGLNVLGETPDLPEEAWPWVFPPQSEKVIRGWHRYTGEEGGKQGFMEVPFLFTSPPDSVAGRKGFEDKVGQVTAFFYAATPMDWLEKLGVGADEANQLKVLYPSHRRGEKLCMAYPLAWITIHYVRDPASAPPIGSVAWR